MEENIPRRKRDLRDVSHYFFSSEETGARIENIHSADLEADDISDDVKSRRGIANIKKIIDSDSGRSGVVGSNGENDFDKEDSETVYQTIEKETHALLNSEVSSPSPKGPKAAERVAKHASASFAPLLKTISLIPVVKEGYSLLLNVYFAKVLLHSPYKIYIISTNPHTDSWNYLERDLALPSIVDIDLSKGLQTFSLFDSVDLIVVDPAQVDSFFAFHDAHNGDSTIFDSQGKQLLFLIDCNNVDTQYKEKMAALVDCFLMVSSAQNESLRKMYKIIKAYMSVAPHAQYKCIINEKPDFYLEEFLQREFNTILGQFLNRRIDFIGFCDADIFIHGNNLKWKTKDKEQAFTIETDFLTELKKESWSEDLLSFYQTVISNVKF
jgi:hypothetical protein